MIKLKAFTITEVVVVMVLSAIVVGIIWALFGIVQKEYHLQDTEMHASWQIGELHALLNTDVFTAGPVTYTNDTLTCHFSDYRICYLLRAKEVVRTYSFEPGVKEIYLLPVRQVLPVYTEHGLYENSIKYITILLGDKNDSLRMEFQKMYEPEFILLDRYEN